jgi:NhaA family Na+:H+ antiporter
MKTHAMSSNDAVAGAAKARHAPRSVRFVLDRFLLMPLGVLIAMVWANTFGESYFLFAHDLAYPVNEIGMALFLGLVAQEAYEEMMPGGVLHRWRLAAPLLAAVGGIVAAGGTYAIYVSLNYETMLLPAWPAAVAVDLAAAYYLARMIWPGGRTVLAFVVITALASDAFAVAFAARVEDMSLDPAAITLMAGALAAAAVLRRFRAPYWLHLALPGLLSWLALRHIGLHPALALLPIVPFLPRVPRRGELFDDTTWPRESQANRAVHEFEQGWNLAVQIILFLFGLVNGGVLLRGYGTGTWAMLTAGVVGRPLGILAGIVTARAVGLPQPTMRWPDMVLLALVISGGFAFPLFFATSIMPMGPIVAEVKLGAFVAAAAALVALLVVQRSSGRQGKRSR